MKIWKTTIRMLQWTQHHLWESRKVSMNFEISFSVKNVICSNGIEQCSAWGINERRKVSLRFRQDLNAKVHYSDTRLHLFLVNCRVNIRFHTLKRTWRIHWRTRWFDTNVRRRWVPSLPMNAPKSSPAIWKMRRELSKKAVKLLSTFVIIQHLAILTFEWINKDFIFNWNLFQILFNRKNWAVKNKNNRQSQNNLFLEFY